MDEQEQGGGFAVGKPDSWKDALPDEEGFGIIEDFCIRDGNPNDRYPRPIRQLNVRVRRLDAVGVRSDGEKFPLSIYANAALERQVNDQSAPGGKKLVWAAKGRNKANHMITNWVKAGLPLADLVLDEPVDGEGNFIPLDEESWESPRTGETVTEHRIHVEACEGIKIQYLRRRRMNFGGRQGGNEAHDVLEIKKVLSPDFEPDEVEEIVIREEGDSSDSPPDASPAFDGGSDGGAPAVDEDEANVEIAKAFDGKKRGDAPSVLTSLPENLRVEPHVTSLLEEGVPFIDELVEAELLKELKSGKLKFIGEEE